jgi:hypothetical protein
MHEEFNEFSDEIHANNFFSNSTEESIRILNEYRIDAVIIKMGKIADASVLKYINDYYKNIKVLISARKDFEEALTIFNQIHFERINNQRSPFKINIWVATIDPGLCPKQVRCNQSRSQRFKPEEVKYLRGITDTV